ncbi:MAG: hypothetical protein JXQ90_23030 [Cyclobacteriaceae bacterium]
MKNFSFVGMLMIILGACHTDVTDDIEADYDYHDNAWVIEIDSNDWHLPNLMLVEQCDPDTKENCSLIKFTHPFAPSASGSPGMLWFEFKLNPDNDLEVNYFGNGVNLGNCGAALCINLTDIPDKAPENVTEQTFEMIRNATIYKIVDSDFGPIPTSTYDTCDNQIIDDCYNISNYKRASYTNSNESLRQVEFHVIHEGAIIFSLQYQQYNPNIPVQCKPPSIQIENQETLDNLIDDYEECIEFESITISGDDIRDLSGLSFIHEIRHLALFDLPNLTQLNGLKIESIKDLTIDGTALNDLTGLEVTKIGSLSIIRNQMLTTMEGLENSSIDDRVSIYANPKLESLLSLSHLEELNGLWIGGNMPNLNGLENLRFVQDMTIGPLPKLQSLSGLENLDSAGLIYITQNVMLKDLGALANLRSADHLDISYNSSLQNTVGFIQLGSLNSLYLNENKNLLEIGGFENLLKLEQLQISRNPDLTYLNGLENLTMIGSSLVIEENGSLTNCSINGICASLNSSISELRIVNNAIGCNSVNEVKDSCGN